MAGPQAPASPSDALSDDAAEFNSGSGEVVFRLGAGGNATTGGTIAASGDPGSTVTATFDVTINADDQPGDQIVNEANATFTGLTLGTSFSDTTPQVVDTVAAPSLTLNKTHVGSLIDGATTTFTLSVTNGGNMPTDGSTVFSSKFQQTFEAGQPIRLDIRPTTGLAPSGGASYLAIESGYILGM